MSKYKNDAIDDTISNGNSIFSKTVRAGVRTYFFDVKSTLKGDCFLTITESKRKFTGEGEFSFQKHRIYLYKEDVSKFEEGLADVINFIKGETGYGIDENSIIQENETEIEEAILTEI